MACRYLEASKLPPRNSANPQDPLLVTLYVWRGILRLLHPTMPFMTEELWSRVPGALGPLIVSQQPLLTPFPVDTQAQAQFSVMKDIVVAIRNARSEHGVKPSEKIGAALFVQDEQLLSVCFRDACVASFVVLCSIALSVPVCCVACCASHSLILAEFSHPLFRHLFV